jgi:hypothetical protein
MNNELSGVPQSANVELVCAKLWKNCIIRLIRVSSQLWLNSQNNRVFALRSVKITGTLFASNYHNRLLESFRVTFFR